MPSLNASPHDVMRRALAKMDESAVMAVVDALQLQGAKVSAVVAVPLRNLQKKRDLGAFAAGAPIDAVAGLLEVLSLDPLEKMVGALGEHAEAPNYEQLSSAVTSLRGDVLSDDQLVAVLALAIGNDFPAASHCRRILGEDEALALPEIEITVGHASLLSPKVVDESVREQRRLRREEAKVRKRAHAAKSAPPRIGARPRSEKKKPSVPSGSLGESKVAAPPAVSRRSVQLTPAESALFDPAHALAGAVLTAEVPFDSVDPLIPEQQSKVRPVLVVAASPDGMLVRGIYSQPAATRSVFAPWRRLGFDHVSYIDVARVAVSPDADLTRLGMLNDEEWNALL